MQFYIIKDMNQGIPYGPRGKRDYSSFPKHIQRGIKWHKWFENYYTEYSHCVRQNLPPPKGDSIEDDQIIAMFHRLELERYHTNPDLWFPLARELYTQSDFYRGTIDRLDLLNLNGDCRIVDYKSAPKLFDNQEMMFYAYLITQELDTLKKDYPITSVKEVSNYYYATGEFRVRAITPDDLATFEQFLQSIRDEIMEPNWLRKEDCNQLDINCLYKPICSRILPFNHK